MGCGESVPDDIPSKPTAIKTSASKQNIALTIKVTGGQFDKANLRILILGPGDTGKSTLGFQIDSLYNTIDQSVISEYAKQIKQLIIADAKAVINQVDKNGQQVSDKLQKGVVSIKESQISPEALTPEFATIISNLWVDPTFKTAFGQINDQLHENAEYFLSAAEAIAKPDFKPTTEQILKASIPTHGYKTHCIKVNQFNTEVVEIGGEKSERESWYNTYKDVDLIVYVASLSDFNQTINGEPETSRTQDSLSLFSQIAANPLFAETPIFLVLNKSDVFARKLTKDFETFKRVYPGFPGTPGQIAEAIEHVREAYLRQLDKDRSKNAWVEVESSQALNTENVQGIIDKVAKKLYNIGEKKEQSKDVLKEPTTVVAPTIVVETNDEKDNTMVEAAPFEEAVKETVVQKRSIEASDSKEEFKKQDSEKETKKKHDSSDSDSDSDDDSLSDTSLSSSGSSLSSETD